VRIDELRTLERRKQSVGVGTAEFVDLAVKAANQAKLTFRWCQMQLILANWREAPFRLEIARPGSAEAMSAADDIERLREEYQVAHEAILATERRGE
jgi:hypothetical protein